MEYKVDNEFVTSTVNYLNAMNDVEAGAKTLSSLINSKNMFDFTNTASASGDRTFQIDYKSNDKYKEVGAYRFGWGVASNSKYGSPLMLGFGNETTEGQAYNNAIINMMYGFDDDYTKSYQNAITNFSKGSSVNNYGKGVYRNHKIDPQYKPLIFKFLPLIKLE